MREIKFRVWDDIAKRMFYPEQHARYCITMIGTVCNDETDRGGILENRNYRTKATFWTGLHDKNGKEIYEKDILQCTNTTWIWHKNDRICVEWPDALTGLESLNKWPPSEIKSVLNYFIVVGNIYENPELLKGA